MTILQGEGLVKEATALIAYRAAVVAAVTGASLPTDCGVSCKRVPGAVATGLAIGWCIRQLSSPLDDVPVIQRTLSRLTPYAAYIPADHAGLSGVLAVVSTGTYLGWYSPQLLSPATRLQAEGMGT